MERTLACPSAIFSLMSRSRSRVSLLFLCPCASLASSRRSRSRSLRLSSLHNHAHGVEDGRAVSTPLPKTVLKAAFSRG